MFLSESQILVFGLVFWLFWFGIDSLYYIYKSKKSGNPHEEISEEDIYYDQENKVWLWEVDGHWFSNEEFHMQQGGKIEDFENWIRDKEPVDSIEDVTSYKVHWFFRRLSMKQFIYLIAAIIVFTACSNHVEDNKKWQVIS